jgi:acyl-CoA thioesterase-2
VAASDSIDLTPFEPVPEEATSALRQLLAVLSLNEDGVEPDTFVGRQHARFAGRVFGGQVLAQALTAAQQTVDDDRPVHSMHGYFLRPGDPGEPITFSVERLRDGRSFSARRTHAVQRGRPILSMISSFQEVADGLEHQVTAPEVPGPEELPALWQRYPEPPDESARRWLWERPIDLRHVSEPIFAHAKPQADGTAALWAVWFRTVAPLPSTSADNPILDGAGLDGAGLHAAVLAFASDYTILEPTLVQHGIPWITPGLKIASLDHAMWWHRPARADEWLLYVQQSPSASGARALGLGRIFARDGALVASVAQEGMVRLPR